MTATRASSKGNTKHTSGDDASSDADAVTALPAVQTTTTKKKRAKLNKGVGAKDATSTTANAALATATTSKPGADDDDEGVDSDGRHYFLIKSEPESRIQNGHEMKFSIDDLKDEPESTAHWDGVRNYEARNTMRAMKVGDRAFFYHSNCRKVRPAIVGEVEVVRESYPDHTAFDRKDPHFDPKSKEDSPRWFMVDVRFIRKFDTVVTLDDVKKCADLGNMQLVKRGRISVQRVTSQEWRTILGMAGVDLDDQTP